MYRDLLVHAKPCEPWSSHLDTAITLAARHRAFLTALVPLTAEFVADPAPVDALRRRFEGAALPKGVRATFRAVPGAPPALLTAFGRVHDLVIVEQTEAGAPAQGLSAEDAAVRTGRPTLIVPHAGTHRGHFPRILVAWNGGLEAARALSAAMPLLAEAEAVVLVDAEPAADLPREGLDIAPYLSRHAKALEVHARDVPNAEAAEVILAGAAQARCDLIVMGARGRLQGEGLELGGATSAVLAAAHCPILAAT